VVRKPTVLIVDNDPRLLRSLKRWLEDGGKYRVLTASTVQDALDLFQTECIHCISLDVVLTSDARDRSGFDLARKLGKTPKFFLSMLTDGDSTRRGLSVEMVTEAKVKGYLFKSDNEQVISNKVEEILEGLNLDMVIDWGSNYTSLMLIEMLKTFRNRSLDEKKILAEELELLFCTAFKKASKVTVLDVKRGRSGCAVAQLMPMGTVTGAAVMVKFGPRSIIMQEHENYNDWVKGVLQHELTVMMDEELAETSRLAAIKYSFSGGSGKMGSFRQFFARSSANDISDLITHLIEKTCEKWYETHRSPDLDENVPLDQLYRSRGSLNLLDSDDIDELDSVVHQLLNSKKYGLNLKAAGPTRIQVKLGSLSELLPNPLVYALRERWNNGFQGELFPSPSQLCIQHGDLNGDNILVSDSKRGFLIDFYKTGFSHTFRDFVELESIVKFELLQLKNVAQRYRLELDLLAPTSLAEPIRIAPEFARDPEILKIIQVVQTLRGLAATISNDDDPSDYYIGLMFHALKEIVGFSSGVDGPACCKPEQFHALLSAAKICEKLVRQHETEAESTEPLIFLSYAGEDIVEINSIYKRLADEGYRPWMDKYDLVGGEGWEVALELALEAAHAIIVVLSSSAVKKRGWNQTEIKKALELSKRTRATDIYIIPVMIEPGFPIPFELRNLQFIKLYEPDGWDRLLQSLKESVVRRNT
jgi:DNA-binding response OmpR family regulator